MPLGTLDRTAPPLFNQGQSALSKLIFFGALSLFLMVADARFHIVQPIRAAVGAVLYPVQWVALKPVQAVLGGGRYFEDLQTAAQRGRRPQGADGAGRARGPGRHAGAGQRPPARTARTAPDHHHAGPRRRGALRRCRPLHPQDRHRPGHGPGRAARLAGDRRARRARAGHAGAALHERSHAGDRPRPFHSRAEHPHRRAQRGLRRRLGARRRAGAALHGRQRRLAGGRPALHQRRRRHLPRRPAGGEDRAHRAACRLRLRPHLLPAAGPRHGRALRAGARTHRHARGAAAPGTRSTQRKRPEGKPGAGKNEKKPGARP